MLGVYYLDGANVQQNGVKIDYVVEPTANGLKDGKDEVLDKAVSLLKCR